MASKARKTRAGSRTIDSRPWDESDAADDAIDTDRLAAQDDGGHTLDFPDLQRTRFAERIEPDEVNGWARQLGVSPERLREAIRIAGDTVDDVKRYLSKPH
jgi:hypothetical protein